MNARLSMLQYRLHKLPDRMMMRIAWLLPRRVTTWAAIRVITHATTGAYSSQIVPELTAMEALDRWEDD